jgi:hypothetical protein
MPTLEFYNERAAECRAEARDSGLVNVRDRYLSAASAWDNMADRVRKTKDYRVEDAARKVAEGLASEQGNAAGNERTRSL